MSFTCYLWQTHLHCDGTKQHVIATKASNVFIIYYLYFKKKEEEERRGNKE